MSPLSVKKSYTEEMGRVFGREGGVTDEITRGTFNCLYRLSALL